MLRLAGGAAILTAIIGIIARHSRGAYELDHRVRRWMRSNSTRTGDRAAEIISACAEPSVQVPLCAVLTALAVAKRQGRRRETLSNATTYAPFAATLAAIGAHQAIKALFPRKRPLAARLGGKTQPSYPSGHTATTAALTATAALLTMHGRAPTRERRAALTAAVLVPSIVGAARVYSGKHWATDVGGGWTLGLATAALAMWAADELTSMQRRNGNRRRARRPRVVPPSRPTAPRQAFA